MNQEIFYKRVKRKIRKKFNVVDIHVHTDYSDGNFSVRELVKKCKRRKIGACVTDHNYIKGSVELCSSDVFSVPSIEVTSRDCMDLLVYFYD